MRDTFASLGSLSRKPAGISHRAHVTQNRSWTKCLGYSHKLFDQSSNRLYGKSVPKDLTPLNYGAVLSLIRLDIVSALLESNFLLVQQ